MGPNIYITPPGSFTKFHQDGHGTVDSGHQCLRGYNEVVMLRRLTETHKINAIRILNGKDSSIDDYDALYGLPHAEKLVRCITSFFRPLFLCCSCNYICLCFAHPLFCYVEGRKLSSMAENGRHC